MEFLQKLADSVSTGYRLIGLVLGIVLLTGLLFTGYRALFHKPGVVAKPEITPGKDWKKVDFSNEDELLDYINQWLGMHAPEVLNDCVPNHIPVKDCVVRSVK